MYYNDETKIWHCIAIMSETSDLILLCSSSGYAYMRYSSVITRQDYTEQFRKRCNCTDCDRSDICIHKDDLRRFPREIGGIALCPKLAINTEVEKKEKPVVKYNSQNEQGNIFQVLFLTQVKMKKHGLADEYKKMRLRVFESSSYEQALGIIREYVDLIDTVEKS